MEYGDYESCDAFGGLWAKEAPTAGGADCSQYAKKESKCSKTPGCFYNKDTKKCKAVEEPAASGKCIGKPKKTFQKLDNAKDCAKKGGEWKSDEPELLSCSDSFKGKVNGIKIKIEAEAAGGETISRECPAGYIGSISVTCD